MYFIIRCTMKSQAIATRLCTMVSANLSPKQSVLILARSQIVNIQQGWGSPSYCGHKYVTITFLARAGKNSHKGLLVNYMCILQHAQNLMINSPAEFVMDGTKLA